MLVMRDEQTYLSGSPDLYLYYVYDEGNYPEIRPSRHTCRKAINPACGINRLSVQVNDWIFRFKSVLAYSAKLEGFRAISAFFA